MNLECFKFDVYNNYSKHLSGIVYATRDSIEKIRGVLIVPTPCQRFTDNFLIDSSNFTIIKEPKTFPIDSFKFSHFLLDSFYSPIMMLSTNQNNVLEVISTESLISCYNKCYNKCNNEFAHCSTQTEEVDDDDLETECSESTCSDDSSTTCDSLYSDYSDLFNFGIGDPTLIKAFLGDPMNILTKCFKDKKTTEKGDKLFEKSNKEEKIPERVGKFNCGKFSTRCTAKPYCNKKGGEGLKDKSLLDFFIEIAAKNKPN